MTPGNQSNSETTGSRSLRGVYPAANTLEGAGVPIKRALPTRDGRYEPVDPFLLLDDVELRVTGGPSFPPHPHRGFEIITYLLSGGMTHEDSEGHRATVGPLGLQHILTGSGMWHGEEHDHSQGTMRGLQMWINLARSEKSREPAYTAVNGPDVPVERVGHATIRKLAGEGGAVALVTPAIYYDVTIDPSATENFPIADGWQGFVYVLSGLGSFGNPAETVGDGEIGILGPTGGLTVIAGTSGVRFMLGAGQPLREPIRWRGPYVD